MATTNGISSAILRLNCLVPWVRDWRAFWISCSILVLSICWIFRIIPPISAIETPNSSCRPLAVWLVQSSKGEPMNRFLVLIALAVLTASIGCTSLKTGGWLSSQSTPGTQSQPIPEPPILRTAWQDNGYGDGMGCCYNSNECGCEPGCGCHGPSCCGCNSGCACGGPGPDYCGFCNRYRGCACGAYQQGIVNGAVCGALDGHHKDNRYNFTPGPPVAQTAYPYYTVHGPRDFLLNNPPSLGPY